MLLDLFAMNQISVKYSNSQARILLETTLDSPNVKLISLEWPKQVNERDGIGVAPADMENVPCLLRFQISQLIRGFLPSTSINSTAEKRPGCSF